MAILKSQIPMVGSLGNLSFFNRADTEEIIVRQKGGPSKKAILTSDNFVITRLNMSEFGGRVKGSQFIHRTLRPLLVVAKGNVFNALQGSLNTIQHHDKESRKGQRSILISRKPKLLEGFTLDKKRLFENFVATPLSSEISPATATAQLTIPELVPGTNLFLPDRFPFYQIICSFSAVPDFHFTEHGYKPGHQKLDRPYAVYSSTPWLLSKVSFSETQLTMTLGDSNLEGPFVFMLSVALHVGMPSSRDVAEAVKYQGAGKILSVVPSEGSSLDA